jgi:hypothetical protein
MNIDADGPIKVLVVDDEEMIRELYAQILSNEFPEDSSPSRADVSGSESAAGNSGPSEGALSPPPV